MARSLVFIWPWLLPFWAVYLWAFIPEFALIRRDPGSGGAPKDRGSMGVIMAGNSLAGFLAFPLAFVRPLSFPPSAVIPAYIAGIAVLIGGSLLRRHCWRVLGQWFTGYVDARPEQPVVNRGAYRWLRHPSYTGGILMFLGIGIALANWASLAVLVLAPIIAYSYRMHVEERALLETIGQPYAEFMRTRKRLVPFVY
jgi:protein-S-isoprenylcysteine O-methyltransferase Ste14